MKNNKRTLALLTAGLLAVTPMAATGLTAFAEGPNKITINSAKAGTHDYKAYQIFKGTLQGAGTAADPYILTELQWGDNVTGAGFLTAIKADDAFLIDQDNDSSTPMVNAFASAASAKDVADVLEEYADDSDFAVAFAKFAGNHLNDAAAAASDNTADTTDTKKYELGNLAAGYYLVKDEASITQDTPRTLNMLKVAGTVTIDTKEDLPTIDKKIITDKTTPTTDVKNEASIGDVIDYQLTSVVPTMVGYDKYFYVINDKMAEGLTFDASSVKVYIDGTELVNSGTKKYYRVDQGDAAKVGNVQYTFQIVMNDFIQHKAQAGKEIKVTYSAKLNEKADITNTGNPNKVFLTYSNNPNVEATPESTTNPDEPKVPSTPPDTPDNPGDDYDSPVGVTPWSDVNTFTTAIKVIKVDDSTPANPLKGAEFKLTGNDMNIVLVSEDQFILDNTTGTYWELTDGTYTTTDPSTSGVDTTKYVDTSKKYKRTTIFTQKGNIATPVDVKGFVDDDGYIIFKGLGAGTYELEETTTPNGYNTVPKITIVISNDKVANAFSKTNPNWKVVKDADPDVELTASENIYGLQVVNVKGSTLPSTGGMGTRLFYIIGGLLVAGSLVLLVTKKRMSRES